MLSLRPSFVIFRSSPNTRYISTSYLFRAYHVILVPAVFRLLPSSGNHRSGNERNQTSNSLTLLAGAGKLHLLPTNIQSSSSSERQTEFDRTRTKNQKLEQTTTIPPYLYLSFARIPSSPDTRTRTLGNTSVAHHGFPTNRNPRKTRHVPPASDPYARL